MKKLFLTLLGFVLVCTIANAQVTCPPTVPTLYSTFSKPVVLDQKIDTAYVCDPDVGQTETWSIVETGTPFKIVNGVVMVADPTAINSTTTATYNITIKVTDNGTPPLSRTAIESMTNTNSPPVINAQTFVLNENSPNATVVGTVIATDPNAGQTKTFSILSGNTNGAFSINASTGVLVVTNTTVLNFEATPSFALVIRVSDNGNPSLSAQATITVNLLDVNEAPVVLDQNFQ